MPECDVGEFNREIPYNQTWLPYAIPSSDGHIDSCTRYAPKSRAKTKTAQCTEDMFDNSVEIACSEFVYSTDERNLQTEVKTIFTMYIRDRKLIHLL